MLNGDFHASSRSSHGFDFVVLFRIRCKTVRSPGLLERRRGLESIRSFMDWMGDNLALSFWSQGWMALVDTGFPEPHGGFLANACEAISGLDEEEQPWTFEFLVPRIHEAALDRRIDFAKRLLKSVSQWTGLELLAFTAAADGELFEKGLAKFAKEQCEDPSGNVVFFDEWFNSDEANPLGCQLMVELFEKANGDASFLLWTDVFISSEDSASGRLAVLASKGFRCPASFCASEAAFESLLSYVDDDAEFSGFDAKNISWMSMMFLSELTIVDFSDPSASLMWKRFLASPGHATQLASDKQAL